MSSAPQPPPAPPASHWYGAAPRGASSGPQAGVPVPPAAPSGPHGPPPPRPPAVGYSSYGGRPPFAPLRADSSDGAATGTGAGTQAAAAYRASRVPGQVTAVPRPPPTYASAPLPVQLPPRGTVRPPTFEH
jgi:hypothetical protein